MLDFMRRHSNSWIMILLFAIIIFVFAINFGPWAGNIQPSVPYAAIVNNEPISMAEFRAAYANQFARIKQVRPDYDQALADKDGLRRIVLDQLVARELLTQLGRKHDLSVGARVLAEEIKARVFGDAEFNKEEYVKRINSYFQSTIPQFEEQVAKDLVASQMATLLSTGVFVSDKEVLNAFKDRETKVAVDFVKVSPKFFQATQPISADQIKKFKDENGKKISDYYNENISEYVKDSEVKASHILVKVPQNATPEEKKTLKDKAQKILERVKKNEDFAEIAKKESDDAGSKAQGGDLGYFSQGMMVEEFSKAAFALKPGEVSGIVESPFGFHIIKVMDQKPKVERKLDEVSNEIAEVLIRKEEGEKKAREFAEKALLKLKEGTPIKDIKIAGLFNVKAAGKQPDNPNEPIADETEPFSSSSRFVLKLGRAEPIALEAGKLTMADPTAQKVIEANGDFFAIRLKSKQEPDMAKFAEQKEVIKSSLVYPRKRELIQQYLAHLKSGAKITYNKTLLAAQDEATE